MWNKNDLILIQFPEKQRAVHSNYVMKAFNYGVIISIMLKGNYNLNKVKLPCFPVVVGSKY